jgi:hypothetical protein
METIYVSPHDVPITTVDGCQMSVKLVLVSEAGGFISIQDWEPPTELDDVEIVLVRKFRPKRFQLPHNVKQAILHFLQRYHAKQDISFDCYAFANLVRGAEVHKVPYMLKYWNKKPKPWFVPIGSIVFFESGENQFHHAAVYIGHGLYISVWGAGGDLEIATLKTMKRDYGAERVVLAEPVST